MFCNVSPPTQNLRGGAEKKGNCCCLYVFVSNENEIQVTGVPVQNLIFDLSGGDGIWDNQIVHKNASLFVTKSRYPS